MKERLSYYIISTAFILLLSNNYRLHAKTSAVNFIQLQPGPRIASLSGAFASISGDPWNLFNAIAETTLATTVQIGLSHVISIEDIYYEAVAATIPLTKKSIYHKTLSAGMLYKHYNLSLTDEGGELTGQQITPKDVSGVVGFASEINKNISVGLGAKYIYSLIDNYSTWALAFDASIMYRTMLTEEPIHFLFSSQNMGTSMQYAEKKESLPITFHLTSVYRVLDTMFHTIDLNMGVKKIVYQSIELMAGYEHVLGNVFVYRVGYKIISDGLGWISLGAGLKYKHYIINYSYQPLIQLGTIHQIGIEFRF